ncbi:MAG TPA: 4Fe-4S dicluster domain-containing protein [Methanothermococcus okinawensis]|uniref:4Fe-4S dicluster domain-containing protein n=1 Tax=Methanothermococcus okinawensis TaxID=155863 RepID=A0A833E4M7_9EURY|nr:4Fe-4S dicluster domain-containing protein [Methanothermococcus okinawensis]HIP90709.1 4Fe-4S dicluster domain-containing protein [Methanothermococcus okinawensis]
MKKRIYYWVHEEYRDKPVISKVILETKVMINILMAKMKPQESFLILELSGEERQIQEALNLLKKYGEYEDIPKIIEKNKERCIDCGACVVHCPVNAISQDRDFTIVFNEEECIGCKNCVKICPLKAIEVREVY